MKQAGVKSLFVFVRMYLILLASLFSAGTISCLITGFILGSYFTDGSDGIEAEYALMGLMGAGYGALINAGIITVFRFLSQLHQKFKALPSSIMSSVMGVIGTSVAVLYLHLDTGINIYIAGEKSFVFNLTLLFSVVGAIAVLVVTKYLSSKKGGCDVYIN